VVNDENTLDADDKGNEELLGPVYYLSLDQQSGIHCLIICEIQLLTLNSFGGT